jgi:hypothetical protein
MAVDGLPGAAALRTQRMASARWFDHRGIGTELAWSDLTGLPAWAWADAVRLDAWALHAGAWRHAQSLRRCIDGRTRAALRAALGAFTFDALMAEEAAARAPDLPAAWPTWLRDEGCVCLLASVAPKRLRMALRDHLWPHLPPDAVGPMSGSAALAIVRRTEACLTKPAGLELAATT